MLMKQWSNYTIVYNARARYGTLTHPLLMRDLFLFSSAGRDTPETAGKCQPRHFADLKKKKDTGSVWYVMTDLTLLQLCSLPF